MEISAVIAVIDAKFKARMPRNPYCSDDPKKDGTMIRALEIALGKRYIQLNPPGMAAFLIFDIDREGAAFAADDAGLPSATFTVVNPSNAHAHMIYALKSPVCVSENGRDKPREYMEAVLSAYTLSLGADWNYTGPLCKNPFCGYWETITANAAIYDLATLADSVELSPYSSRRAVEGIGRNCDTFEKLRKWAYRAIGGYWTDGFDAWMYQVSQMARAFNCALEKPLFPNEVSHIAKSVARWTWREITPERLEELIARTHTPGLQRARRAKRTEKESRKGQGLALLRQGFGVSETARALKVDRSTVKRWKQQ